MATSITRCFGNCATADRIVAYRLYSFHVFEAGNKYNEHIKICEREYFKVHATNKAKKMKVKVKRYSEVKIHEYEKSDLIENMMKISVATINITYKHERTMTLEL